jgi:hypothetical protein
MVVVVVVMVMVMRAQHPVNHGRNDVMVVMMMVMILSGLNAAGNRLLSEPRIISL